MTVRVLLAEDQAMARGALPDVALLDIEMPGGDGLSAAATLKERLPSSA